MSDARVSLDETYLQMAELWGNNRSYATRLKVGALLVKGTRIISDGYNGMPTGFPNDEMELKLLDGELVTNPLALHAESNAILKCAEHGAECAGATLYIAVSPCIPCCKLIIQAKIARVVYRTPYRDLSALPVLAQAKIEVVHLPPPHVHPHP